jgi:hypothetical protein
MAHQGARDQAPPWHPQAGIDLRRLAEHRRELGAGPFTRLLTQAAGNTDLADTVTSLLDEVDKTDGGTA